jgi:hypothetical protein
MHTDHACILLGMVKTCYGHRLPIQLKIENIWYTHLVVLAWNVQLTMTTIIEILNKRNVINALSLWAYISLLNSVCFLIIGC